MAGGGLMSATTEERLAAIESRLATVERVNSETDYIERKLLDAARQYARCVKLGFFLETRGNGEPPLRVQFCKPDTKMYADSFESTMQSLAIELIRIEAAR
jgi:hypothetical protein